MVYDVFRNIMGQGETMQVSRVHTLVLVMNASLNTSDIPIYIPMNKSEYSLYEHTQDIVVR